MLTAAGSLVQGAAEGGLGGGAASVSIKPQG